MTKQQRCTKYSNLNTMKKYVFILLAVVLFANCTKKKQEPIKISPDDLHNSIDHVIDIMIHDIFSPPVASRIFAYPNIAAYEIVAQTNPDYQSLSGQLKDLKPIPAIDTASAINPQLSALIAHMNISRQLIFSEDKFDVLQDSLFTKWKNMNEPEFEASKTYGLKVAEHIKEWMNKDNYSQTRTMPKFTVNTDDPARWQPTLYGWYRTTLE